MEPEREDGTGTICSVTGLFRDGKSLKGAVLGENNPEVGFACIQGEELSSGNAVWAGSCARSSGERMYCDGSVAVLASSLDGISAPGQDSATGPSLRVKPAPHAWNRVSPVGTADLRAGSFSVWSSWALGGVQQHP